MAWIELHQTVWTHRKTLEMAAILGVQPIIAVAHIAQLWTWALDNARLDFDGKRALLTGIRPGVIAMGAQWQGDADTFMAAVIESGYVDRDGDDLIIHEWWDRAGKYVERREANAERMRKLRAPHVDSTSEECAAHVQRTDLARAQPTVQYQTVPTEEANPDSKPVEILVTDVTDPDLTDASLDEVDEEQAPHLNGNGWHDEPIPDEPVAEPAETGLPPPWPDAAWIDEAFEQSFWASYPRKTHKQPARQAYLKLMRRQRTFEAAFALAQTITEAVYEQAQHWTDPTFAPHPATYLNDERWTDEHIIPTGRGGGRRR